VARVKKAVKRWVAVVVGFAASLGLASPVWAQKCGESQETNNLVPGQIRLMEAEEAPLGGAIFVEPPPARGKVRVTPVQSGAVPETTASEVEKPARTETSKKTTPNRPDFSDLLPWAMVAFIFASLCVLIKKRSSMWIVGVTMAALFAALGYVWSVSL
jgi:hypothetical protein